MNVIRVKVNLKGPNTLKVRWGDSEIDFLPYNIDRDLIKRKAKDVRDKLASIIEEARENEFKQIGYHLKELVELGNGLYQALFTSEEEQHKAQKVLNYLKDIPKPFRIHFTVDKRIHIPWGLIYDGETIPPDKHNGDLAIDKYRDFWCLKYSVSTSYSIIEPSADKEISSDDLKILPLFHKAVYERVVPNLDKLESDAMSHMFLNFSEFEIPLFESKHFLVVLHK
ncbi:MAG: hypothetical protein GY749_17450 [Desulfobacteraceae bacterium]|nr:hypothetical protein [Desulfobacteraceae bacterium]